MSGLKARRAVVQSRRRAALGVPSNGVMMEEEAPRMEMDSIPEIIARVQNIEDRLAYSLPELKRQLQIHDQKLDHIAMLLGQAPTLLGFAGPGLHLQVSAPQAPPRSHESSRIRFHARSMGKRQPLLPKFTSRTTGAIENQKELPTSVVLSPREQEQRAPSGSLGGVNLPEQMGLDATQRVSGQIDLHKAEVVSTSSWTPSQVEQGSGNSQPLSKPEQPVRVVQPDVQRDWWQEIGKDPSLDATQPMHTQVSIERAEAPAKAKSPRKPEPPAPVANTGPERQPHRWQDADSDTSSSSSSSSEEEAEVTIDVARLERAEEEATALGREETSGAISVCAQPSTGDLSPPPPWMQLVTMPTIYLRKKASCKIANVGDRAISIKQLSDLAVVIEAAFSKVDILDPDTDAPTSLGSINMYGVSERFLKPITSSGACSFVEKIAISPQPPAWFVSHAWASPFRQTHQILSRHARERQVPALGYYWVCAFANNLHHETPLPTLLKDAPFIQALASPECAGTILVLDSGMRPLKRLWCLYEMDASLTAAKDSKPRFFDMASWVEGTPGASHVSLRLGGGEQTSSRDAGAAFPALVAVEGMKIEVGSAQTSCAADQDALMRYITGSASPTIAATKQATGAMQRRLKQYFLPGGLEAAITVGDSSLVQATLAEFPDAKDLVLDPTGLTPLFVAAEHGCVPSLQVLLDLRANVNVALEDGRTPLFAASFRGHAGAVNLLLAANAHVNEAATGGSSPLCIAAINGQLPVLEALIRAGADKDAPASGGFTPLAASLLGNQTQEAFQALLRAGADINAAALVAAVHLQVDALNALLFAGADSTDVAYRAVAGGHVQALNAMLQLGASLEGAPGQTRGTLVYEAVVAGQVEMLRILAASSADVNQAHPATGVPPLQEAAKLAESECVQILLEAGASATANSPDGSNACFVAAEHGRNENVRCLVQARADVTAAANVAVQHGSARAVEMLVAAGANREAALAQARQLNRSEIFKLLTTSAAGSDQSATKGPKDLLREQSEVARNRASLEVQTLLERRADLNRAAFAAAETGIAAKLEALLEAGVDKNLARQANGATLACLAAEGGHAEAVSVLLDAGADMNIPTAFGDTPYSFAYEQGHASVVSVLAAAGISMDGLDERPSPEFDGEGAADVSTTSNAGGERDMIQELLKMPAFTDERIEELGQVHVAAQSNDAEALRTLLAGGADMHEVSRGMAPLALAVQAGSDAAIRELVKARANVNDPVSLRRELPTCIAAQYGHTSAMATLLGAGADLDASAALTGVTALCSAAGAGHVAMVQMLLEAGADKDKAMLDGAAPLFVAASRGKVDCMEVLLQAGANKNQAASEGTTPLYIAAAMGSSEAVKMLVDARADVDLAMSDGATPLFGAALHGHAEVVRLLAEAGANKDVVIDGTSATTAAVQAGHAAVVRTLFDMGADFSQAPAVSAARGDAAMEEVLRNSRRVHWS